MDDLQPLITALSRIVDQGAQKQFSEGKLSCLFEEEGFATRLARIYNDSEESGQVVMGMIMGGGGGGFRGAEMLNLLRNKGLVDCVSDLVGPDIIGASAYRIRPNLTPHASFVNKSNGVRWSVDLRYQSMDAPNNAEEDPDSYTPERDPVTMACYPSEADFVIRDSKHPEREIRTPEAFRWLRDRFRDSKPYNPGRGWNRLKDKV